MGLGRTALSSAIRVPRPPARITAFIALILPLIYVDRTLDERERALPDLLINSADIFAQHSHEYGIEAHAEEDEHGRRGKALWPIGSEHQPADHVEQTQEECHQRQSKPNKGRETQ